jgi:UDP-N-acetylglucosamine 4,6-dehydratase
VNVLITGGTGSAGRAFAKRLLQDDKLGRLVIFSRDEMKQEQMEREFAPLDPQRRMRYYLGDIRDRERLTFAMQDIDVVIHAAALKIVPKAEIDPSEYIKTNVLGSDNVVHAAIRAGVKKVIALSTDKAAASNTLYGSTKHCAERLFVAANNMAGRSGPRFGVVRYGNVIGSRASVIPLFTALRDSGAKSLPITHPEMTRFLLALEDAVEFTLSSLEMMAGGEIFVPKIGAKRIVDLAREIAPDLPHEIVGIRPAEKIHEVLITEDEARVTLEMSDRYVIRPFDTDWKYDHLPGAKPVRPGFTLCSANAIAAQLEAAE